ncbi:MAG TPA: ribulose-phosphate 3-epimerase [Bacillota bacterium]
MMAGKAEGRLVIAPSLLSANFADLVGALTAVAAGGGDWVHLDVMDGHFVPNITFGPLIVRAVRALTDLPLDVHLMVYEPERFIDDFAAAGADRLTVHVEATPHVHRALQRIRERGLRAGVAINPGTPWQAVEPLLAEVDLILVMTVNPGFPGQALIPACLDKVRQVVAACRHAGCRPWIQVDGGIGPETAPLAVTAGANALVAGSAVFDQPDPAEAVRNLRRSVQAARA